MGLTAKLKDLKRRCVDTIRAPTEGEKAPAIVYSLRTNDEERVQR